jgi:hypothetical protein
MRVPSGSTIEDEDFGDSLEEDLSLLTLDDDLESSLTEDEELSEDFSLDEDLASPFSEEEESSPSSTEEEDSSAEGSAEAEELSSPHAANRNAEEIKKGRIFL